MSNEILMVSGEYAIRVSNVLENILLPAQTGWYKEGDVAPTFSNDCFYYSREMLALQGRVNHLDIEEIIKHQTAINIYDGAGNVVAPATVMKNAKRVFTKTDTPKVNINAYHVLKWFIMGYFDDMCPHRSKGFSNKQMREYLIENCNQEEVNDILLYILDDLSMTICQFVNGDYWNTYNAFREHNYMIVEKDRDFRIDEWERLKKEGVIP